MARNYPKFLTSHVNNVKMTGVFITHLLFPISLYLFEWKAAQGFTLTRIENWGDDALESDYTKVYDRMKEYVTNEINTGKIIR